jgi:hypothetical protein
MSHMTPYATQGQGNPLTSPSTSFGNVWFSPSKDGYTANEKYDFAYGAADQKVPMMQLPGGIAQLDPSQEAALTSAVGLQGPQGMSSTGVSTSSYFLWSCSCNENARQSVYLSH